MKGIFRSTATTPIAPSTTATAPSPTPSTNLSKKHLANFDSQSHLLRSGVVKRWSDLTIEIPARKAVAERKAASVHPTPAPADTTATPDTGRDENDENNAPPMPQEEGSSSVPTVVEENEVEGSTHSGWRSVFQRIWNATKDGMSNISTGFASLRRPQY